MTRLFSFLLLALLLAVTGFAADKPAVFSSAKYDKDIAAYEAADKATPPPQGALLLSGASTLRLWKAMAPSQIDLHAFNSGDYARAAEYKNEFENISWVLYPNDSTPAGRELRHKLRPQATLRRVPLQHLRRQR